MQFYFNNMTILRVKYYFIVSLSQSGQLIKVCCISVRENRLMINQISIVHLKNNAAKK